MRYIANKGKTSEDYNGERNIDAFMKWIQSKSSTFSTFKKSRAKNNSTFKKSTFSTFKKSRAKNNSNFVKKSYAKRRAKNNSTFKKSTFKKRYNKGSTNKKYRK
jgi:hypothetical protein